MIPEVEKIITKKCKIQDESTIIVACSGGPDSMALIDILSRLKSKHNFNLFSAHVNHHLRKDSNKDELIVKKYCLTNNIKFERADYHHSKKDNFENSARNFRNAFFVNLAKIHNAKVALAHNLNDQSESILLHLIRGSGLKGMRGMDYTSKQNNITFFRPLLDYTKIDLEKYCTRKKVKFAKDESNLNTKYKRNWLRHEIIPQIIKHNPKFDNALIRLADSIKHDDDFLDQTAKNVKFLQTSNAITWNRKQLRKLPTSIKRRSIAYGYKTLFGSQQDLSFDHIIRIEQILENCGEYSLPHNMKFEAKGTKAILILK